MTDTNKRRWKYIGIGSIVVVLLMLLKHYTPVFTYIGNMLSVFTPLAVGACMAFVLNIPMSFFERLFDKCKARWVRKIKRPISLLLSLILILAILALVFFMVVPELLNTVDVLVTSSSTAIDKFETWWVDNNHSYPEISEFLDDLGLDANDLRNSLSAKVQAFTPKIVSVVLNIASSAVTIVLDLFMAFVFSLYILFTKEKLKAQLKRLSGAYLKPATNGKFLDICSLGYRTYARFIAGQCTEALILGSLCAAGMLIFRMPYAPMVGALVGVTALIPIVGAFIGAGVGAFMIAMVDPMMAIWFVVYLVILQQLENNLIYPRVVGSQVGLPPILVFTAVMVGGGLFGVLGMMFAVPTTSVCYTLLKEEIRRREEQRNLPTIA